MDEDTLVTSKPCEDLTSLYWQKKRWGVGGLDSDIIGYLVMASGFIAHLFFLIAPFLSSLNIVVLLIYKIALDFAFIKPAYEKLKIRFKITHFFAFQLYFIAYVLYYYLFFYFSVKKWFGKEELINAFLCNYYVTYKCNAYCEFCHFSNHDLFKNVNNASLEDFEKNVEEMAELGVKFIDLTGGEPLLNKEIHNMANFAKKKKMQTSITTNTLLYPKFADKLAGNINLLHFSLDSPNEEEHNKIRKVNCIKVYSRVLKLQNHWVSFPIFFLQ
jgi:uncharacterized radical SAM superfamily Fe-S cluster-containing enzyme